MKKKILYIVLGLLLVGAIVWKIAASRAPKIEYDTQRVERQTLRQTVEVTGQVVSSTDIDLKFEASGRVQTIVKKVGDVVKAGDVLATLDARSQGVGVQKAQAALLSAQAALARLRSGATEEDIHVAEVTVSNAETALAQARQKRADTEASNATSLAQAYGDLDGQAENVYLKAAGTMQTLRNDVFDASSTLRSDISCPDFGAQSLALSTYGSAGSALSSLDVDIAAYRAASDRAEKNRLFSEIVADAKIIRSSAQTANAMMQISYPTGVTTQTAFDTRKASVKTVWTDLNSAVSAAEAQHLLVSSTAASGATALTVAEQAVSTAEGTLASAQAALALKKAPATSFDLASAQASVTQAQATLGEAQLAYDKTRIRAPFAGTVAQVPGHVGTTVTPSDVILKLHGENVYEIEADVPETDVAKIKTGLKAEITLDAYGDDVKFAGELSSIDTAQTVIQDVVYYRTRFLLEAQDRPVRTGMTASMTIVTEERNDAVVVPQRAIREDVETGHKYVRLLVNGAESRKDVTIGLRGDDGLIEVLSGLSGGEEVILAVRENGQIKR